MWKVELLEMCRNLEIQQFPFLSTSCLPQQAHLHSSTCIASKKVHISLLPGWPFSVVSQKSLSACFAGTNKAAHLQSSISFLLNMLSFPCLLVTIPSLHSYHMNNFYFMTLNSYSPNCIWNLFSPWSKSLSKACWYHLQHYFFNIFCPFAL